MIRLEGVSLSFGDVSVLDGVDLQVEPGEFVALVGPNGAGKTTLLRSINGVLDPDEGTVCLDDRDVSTLSAREVSRTVATVPQDTHVGFAFTAEHLVEMGRTPYRSRFDWFDDPGPVEAAMERTETLGLRERTVEELSGGERQRVLLARALAQEPAALLLDEPTASLDINHQVRVLGLVADLVADGQAALAAIHDLDLAARFCDRLCLLHDGSIRAQGPPEQVLSDSRLAEAFETTTAVTHNPVTGTPTVAAFEERPERDARIHVAGGGAGGVAAIRALWAAGFDVSVGVVPEGDVAARLATALELAVVTAPAFERPSADRCRKARDCAREADIVVLTNGPGSRDQHLGPVSAGSEETPPLEDSDTPEDSDTSELEETPHIRADLGGSGSRIARGDGGETAVVDSEEALVNAVLDCLTGTNSDDSS